MSNIAWVLIELQEKGKRVCLASRQISQWLIYETFIQRTKDDNKFRVFKGKCPKHLYQTLTKEIDST